MEAVKQPLSAGVEAVGAPRSPLPFERAKAAAVIFDEDWWLDAAAPGAWDRAQVTWDGELVGEMAFHVTQRWGLLYTLACRT